MFLYLKYFYNLITFILNVDPHFPPAIFIAIENKNIECISACLKSEERRFSTLLI